MSRWTRHQTCWRALPKPHRIHRSFLRLLSGSKPINQADLVVESGASPLTTPNIHATLREVAYTASVHRPIPSVRTGTTHPQDVLINVGTNSHRFSPLLLRDLCTCTHCLDASTRQKHFVTADIPSRIKAKTVKSDAESTDIWWENDIAGYGQDHVTRIPNSTLRQLIQYGKITHRHAKISRILWDAQVYEQQTYDIDYESYMHDDAVVLKAVKQLHTHGLLFITNVPGNEISVEAIGQRIGPLKATFYGRTWDVRAIPGAKNVADTAQNLGFHMDLMYLKQPPHIQLLHVVRSSAKGGASLFSDSFKAAETIARTDLAAWDSLTKFKVNYHYDHPGLQYYHQARPVVEESGQQIGGQLVPTWVEFLRMSHLPSAGRWPSTLSPVDFIDNVSWSPPFQAPFSLGVDSSIVANDNSEHEFVEGIDQNLESWHGAARKFNQLIHRPEAIYERLMKPGECVIFDNRRVLHARRAFEIGDAGTERWLRGAYLDRDPYLSKMKILTDLQSTLSRGADR